VGLTECVQDGAAPADGQLGEVWALAGDSNGRVFVLDRAGNLSVFR
jgi:hypothetical protein